MTEIREKAASGTCMAFVYYITRPSTSGNLLDIFHNSMLQQPLFVQNQCMDIVGVAWGRAEARTLVQQIIMEVYKKTGNLNLSEYFREEDFSDC
jgi:hypothetical protein